MRFTYAHLNPYRELTEGRVLKISKINAITSIYGLKLGQYLVVRGYNTISDELPESLTLEYYDKNNLSMNTINVVLSKQLYEAFDITSVKESQLKKKLILIKEKV